MCDRIDEVSTCSVLKVLERAGRNNSVVKLMPALTIDDDYLKKGLEILVNSINTVKEKM